MMKENKGYTLVEVLVALLIFSIFVGLTAAALNNALITRESVSGRAVKFIKVQNALTIMRRDFFQVINRTVRNEKNQVEPALFFSSNGDKTGITLTVAGMTNPNASQKRSELQRIGYFFKNGIFVRRSWQSLDRVNDNFSDRILLSHVRTIKWEFVGQNNKFYDRWPPLSGEINSLPRGVKITIVFDNDKMLSRLFVIDEVSHAS